ncbi:signal peptidase I [Candidatus Palauibacter sp.]|uniref:signal peptidase I n=1 Tax=Candidatus Palauibacter sp. TaxID=3101350 RepID=UPI003D10FA8B
MAKKRSRDGSEDSRAADAKRSVRELARSLIVAAAGLLFFRTFLLATSVISSGSMEDTLLVGDFLLVNKVALGTTIPFTNARVPGYAEPEYGDIIVFRADHSPGMDLVKRTVGLPGDTLHMEGGVLYRNGVEVEESYVRRDPRRPDGGDIRMLWQREHLIPDAERSEYRPTRDNWGPLVVPRERYFMLGDNRDDSLDSRFWGFVERGKMRGRPFFIYFSYDRDALEPFRVLTAMRPGRLGLRPH